MIYKYKAIHVPTQRVFEREVLQGYMYASGTRVILCQNDFNELLSYWNYQASLQSPVVWMYVKVISPVRNRNPQMELYSDQTGQDPSELEFIDPID